MTSNEFDSNLKNRWWLMDRLRAEVVGPDPVGERVLDPLAESFCTNWSSWPFQTADGEEILWQDPPTKRYGAGILYPSKTIKPPQDQGNSDDSFEAGALGDEEIFFNDKDLKETEKLLKNSDSVGDASEEGEVYGANDYLPSSLGLSFLADLDNMGENTIVDFVSVSRVGRGLNDLASSPIGTYRTISAEFYSSEKKRVSKRTAYVRRPLLDSQGDLPSLMFSNKSLSENRVSSQGHIEFPNLKVIVISRPWNKSKSMRLITISIVNSNEGSNINTAAIFQAGIRVRSDSNKSWIKPYPEFSDRQMLLADDETKIMRLNYRDYKTYAIGHGAAADWLDEKSNEGVKAIWSDTMPCFEMPTTTPELKMLGENGVLSPLQIGMRKLSGLDKPEDQFSDLNILLQEYDRWISGLQVRQSTEGPLNESHVSSLIVERIIHSRDRINRGLNLVVNDEDEKIRKAFELSNLAMYLSQSRKREERKPDQASLKSNIYKFSSPFQPVDLKNMPKNIGFWRPFQIAFLLMSIEGLVSPSSADREEVDLIWFPTGGGKTEAYLGVIAFLLFYRRLQGKQDFGATILMRYTLRLLTAQQFERAATLFCAMEYIRTHLAPELGEERFTIGLWVGAATSPNTRENARIQLKQMIKEPKNAQNPFILRRCPWCAASFGAFWAGSHTEVLGYKREDDTVIFRCPDQLCDFASAEKVALLAPESVKGNCLPVSVIDEDLIDRPPNLIVATVDKFAMLAWKPNLRAFFGLDKHGNQLGDPPSLIIQDELHLISGPLGTIVGAYETVIEELCSKDAIKPKIIASTATISRAQEQIKNLYARDKCAIFPPTGFDANESFFAEESRESDGSLSPGRMYVGVMAPGHMSLQTTQARVYASLLQWPNVPDWSDNEIDPWWTLLCFFNSLRELGSAATIMIADTKDYLRVICSRHGLGTKEFLRSSLFPTELTSRIASDEIPERLNQLENVYRKYDPDKAIPWIQKAVDVCLASSIIEVGVDVPRLSLMAVVGQPKTTAQYIQVTSRIGRRLDRPGLVYTMYSPSKARDRSHFENFKSYHQKVYSFVEPTSVTPFSIPAVERTLHSLAVAFIRQKSDVGTTAKLPNVGIPSELANAVREMIETRVNLVSPIDRDYVMDKLEKRFNEWKFWNPENYGEFFGMPQDPTLMHPAGQTPPKEWGSMSWPTLSSMRGVDASAEAAVTRYYNQPRETQE